jgi:hypothetical protein
MVGVNCGPRVITDITVIKTPATTITEPKGSVTRALVRMGMPPIGAILRPLLLLLYLPGLTQSTPTPEESSGKAIFDFYNFRQSNPVALKRARSGSAALKHANLYLIIRD